MHKRLPWVAAAVILSSCGGDSGTGNSSDPCDVLGFTGSANSGFSATGAFTVSPIATGSISSIKPLGNLNPPGHVYPTSHMYILPSSVVADSNNVYAAAAGTVIKAYQPSTDYKVVIQVDSSFYYFYDHIHLAAGIQEGATVTAGQLVGTNSGDAAAVDFGVYNFNNSPVTGILNACALRGVAYADSPLKYYSGALATTLYGKVIAVSGGATQDGKFDYDQAGKLVGNWVLSGHGPTEAPDYMLSFVYNVANHNMRISVGGTLAQTGSFGVQGGATAFDTVTTASGQVNYQLFPTGSGDSGAPGAQSGVMAVQMLSDTQIKVEILPVGGSAFTSAAQTYDR